jgi:hypothetical protein
LQAGPTRPRARSSAARYSPLFMLIILMMMLMMLMMLMMMLTMPTMKDE